jgi:hypothetical protein
MNSSFPDSAYVVKTTPILKPFATSKKFTRLAKLVEKQYQSVTVLRVRYHLHCEQRMGLYMFSVAMNLLSASF